MTLPALESGSAAGSASPSGWQALLTLGFAARAGATYLAHRRHVGPLVVQRPFFPEGPAVAHAYVLHPPGGFVAGDSVALEVTVDAGAHALLTTPAAGKAYRSRGVIAGRTARVEQRFTVAGTLEWFPQETIVYDGARIELATRVDLAPDATFCGWELVCLGRPASGERLSEGWCRQRFELHRDGVPLVIERTRLQGGEDLLAQPFGLGGQPLVGTMIVAAPAPIAAETLAALRALGEATCVGGVLATATQLEGALVCRYLGDSGEAARRFFAQVWVAIRPALAGRPACPPRIWLT